MKDPIVRITLDLHEVSADGVVSLKYGDAGSRIAISLSEKGFPYEITEDCYAVLTARKPDGSILYNHCDIADNTIFYEVTAQTTARVGRIPAEVKLYGPENRLITSATFHMAVYETICSEEQVESTDEATALTRLVTQALEIVENGSELTETAELAGQAAETAAEAAEIAKAAAVNAAAMVDQAAERIQEAVQTANEASERAEESSLQAEQAGEKAEAALQSVHTLREVVSKFHSNIVGQETGETISLSDASDLNVVGLKFYGKTVQNGTPAPDAPVMLESVGDGGAVNVTVWCGKNLLDYSARQDGYEIMHSTGGISSASGWYVTPWISVLPNTAYTVSGLSSYTRVEANENNTVLLVEKSQKTFTTTPTTRKVRFNSKIEGYDKPQLEEGTAETEYESYKGTKILSVLISGGLYSVPVSSGGNYTDENGQQWICDEVDFARGKYIQRIAKAKVSSVSTAGSTEDLLSVSNIGNAGMPGSAMSTLFPPEVFAGSDTGTLFIRGKDNASVYKINLSSAELNAVLTKNPMTVIYALSEPMETDLSEENKAIYGTLHTNYPNTLVCNDAGAVMEVKYVADTKLYIDNKFAELATVLVNRE